MENKSESFWVKLFANKTGHFVASWYRPPQSDENLADLFLYCYDHDNQADVIEAFNSTSRYLYDLLNIDRPYFEGMFNQIYPPELQLNKANTADTEAPFLDLHLSIVNGFVSSKIYDKRDDL